MKILVCISSVPDTTSKINFIDNNTAFDTTGVQYIINPSDEYALSKAIWFKENKGATITVINVGTVMAEPTLRKALATGADNAIRINAEPNDSFLVAKYLADLIKQDHSYDMILTGKESIDYNGRMVPGIVASLLSYNFVNACVGLELEGQKLLIDREIEGAVEKISANLKLPIVIATQKGIVEQQDLRIPNMKGIMMARKKELTIIEPEQIAPATSGIKYDKPPVKEPVKLVDTVEELIEVLQNEAKVI